MLYKKLILLSLASTLSFANNGDSTSSSNWSVPNKLNQFRKHNIVKHWDYTQTANWDKLNEEYIYCRVGKRQSPINIEDKVAIIDRDHTKITFDYQKEPIDVLNNGHTIELVSDRYSDILVANKRYKLLQLHFHSLSEHTIDGKRYPLEMHMVHQAKDGELAVLGVFFEVGEKANPDIAKIFDNMPHREHETHKINTVEVNINNLLPKKKVFYHYLGSLTTPPCSEVVEWFVFKESVTISKEELEQFQELYSSNYRPTQPLNGRTILINE